MGMLEDAKNEIMAQRVVGPGAEAPSKERKKAMPTKQEREARRAKMIEEEERRILKSMGKDGAVKKKRKGATTGKADDPGKSAKPKATPKRAESEAVDATKAARPKSPRILQPLEPLYLLRIPGLPKGDCLAICYARGADVV